MKTEEPLFFIDSSGKVFVDITKKGKWFLEHKTEAVVMLDHYIKTAPPEHNPCNFTAEELYNVIYDIYLVNENRRILREMRD